MASSVSAITNGTSFLTNALTGNKSGFTNNTIEDMNSGEQLLFIFVLFTLIYLSMYLGSLVFNMSVVKIFPSVKKVSTLDFFGLYIVLHMLFC
jgi:hypothetical protein